MIKEGFSAWFKETFHKEDCLNNAVFTRQSLMDAWDNGYNNGKKEKLSRAESLIKELYKGLDKLYLSGLSDKQIAFVERLQDKTEQFLKEVEA